MAVEARGIVLRYGSHTVLQELNLEVRRGEMLGLVGPNGVGKTTLLRVLSGGLEPQQGEVRIEGAPVRGLRPRERAKRLAVVSQNPVVPHGFTAFQVVLMGRNPYLRLLQWEGATDVQVALEAMRLTGTQELADRLIDSLSGGERQLVLIARALAQQADILLLDEPTAHLDIAYQTAIMDMVAAVRREAGLTVVAAMHDLTLAGRYCDRLAALHQGSFFAVGAPDQVLRPDVVSAVFGAEVSVISHPVHQTPVVIPGGRAAPDSQSPRDL